MRQSERADRWRGPALSLAIFIALAISATAIAQDSDTPQDQLQDIESAIREREARDQGLASEVKDSSIEVERIRRELIDAAAVVQDQETQLDDTEREIEELDRRYAERQAAFEKHRQELERTLAALALYARSPPQALIARPGDWADTVRGLKLLDNAIPALKDSADAAAAEASALAALRDARSQRQADLADNTTALAATRADLRRLLERKSSLHATLVAERRRIGSELSALAAEATDTRDLIDRLEMARIEASARQADVAAARAAQPTNAGDATGSLRADDMVAGVPPPPPDAPVEPAATAPAPTPDLTDPDPGEPAPNADVPPRLADATPLSDAAAESGSAAPTAVPATDLAEPGLAALDLDSEAPPRLVNTAPTPSGSVADLGDTPPAPAPAADAGALETPSVAPDIDASTRLAALPASPPRPPIKSSLPYPAHGDVIAKFGGRDGGKARSLGASIRTRDRAQVVAPRPGEVVFAGPFRGYGRLLILEHDGGYHSLLSGFSRIDAQVGQNVLAGEPVGVMGNVAEDATILYIEIRQDRQPIDPIPWLLAGDRKVSG